MLRLKIKAWLVEQFASCELTVVDIERELAYWAEEHEKNGVSYRLERALLRPHLAFWKAARWIARKLAGALR